MATYQWQVVQALLDPVRGSEQGGLRPVLVVSNEAFNQAIPNLSVLPLTTARRPLYPSEVLISQGVAGVTRDSIVMAHQVRTISRTRLRRTLGYVEDAELRGAIAQAIKEHFDLG